MASKWCGLASVVGSLLFFNLAAVEPIKDSHVHEAFMTKEASTPLLRAISSAPPAPLQEVPSPQTDPQAIWVPGYWEWMESHHDFVWCSGAWRRPPPGHVWIAGYWKQLESGWVRLNGFWSESTALSYLSSPPPDQLNENPGSSLSKDSFWMSGYWHYENGSYRWYRGQWQKWDPNWVYTPATYVWRPEGYIFVQPFWDWPLESRGTAYACVLVDQDERAMPYTPSLILQPLEIVQNCFYAYPDYYYFYAYHYHFHTEWWWANSFLPPWWVWDWWWFSWEDQWALWWWWVHPDWPQPDWIPHDVVVVLPPPPEELILLFQWIQGPFFLSPWGLIPPFILIEVLEAPAHQPVFPEESSSIQEKAKDRAEGGQVNPPTGPRTPPQDLTPRPMPPFTHRTPTGPQEPGRYPLPPTSVPDSPVVQPPPKPQVPSLPPVTPPVYPSAEPSLPPTYSQPPTYYPPEHPQTYYPPTPPSQPYYPPQPAYPPAHTPQQPTYPPSYTPPPSHYPHTPNNIPPHSRPPQYTPPKHPHSPSPSSRTPTRPNVTPPYPSSSGSGRSHSK